jgi:hypothetical protein
MGDIRMNTVASAPAAPGGRRSLWFAAVGLVGFALALLLAFTSGLAPAAAANRNDFDPGRIISDSMFYASGSLSPSETQAVLSSKVSTCRPGYTCLKDYWQATSSIPADQYCKGYNGSAWESAASIISKVAGSCGISPKVMIVLLEKEQGLVTDTWPSARQYSAATGNGCPDTAACDPAVSGFFFQVYYGARAFQRYTLNSGAYNFHAGLTQNVGYHPNTACGASSVRITNAATAALYDYTPYVPNAAAMSNLYGTGDACSSYGNRNFWRIYTDWFGSTISGLDSKDAISLTNALYADILLRAPDAGGLETWRGYLIGQGWPTIWVGDAILYSDEYYLQRIDAAYREVLGREPDAGGRDDWLNRMRTRQVSVDEIRRSFTGSMEFYLKSGGTDASFVSVLYTTLLNRPASDSDVAAWSEQARLHGGNYVIDSIWNSYESGQIRLNRIYRSFLQRDVDASGISSWVPLILAQGDQAARTNIVSSMEYFLNARTRFPQP